MHARHVPALFLTFLSTSALAQLPEHAKDLHEYDLIHVKWELSFNFEKAAIQGDVTNVCKASKDGATLVFDCANLKVSRVTIDGEEPGIEKSKTVLVVTPKKALKKGQTVNVRIQYTGEPEAGIYFVPAKRAFPAKGDILYTQGEMEDNRYWLPTYDYPNDKATSEGIIHVPPTWSALSNGTLLDVKKSDKEAVYHWKIDQPHATYLISLVAGEYSELKDGSYGKAPVSNWIPKGLEPWGDAAFSGTSKIVSFYSKLTGMPYPWPKYSQSAVPDFMFGGMENVSCTTQTITALYPISSRPNNDSTGLVAHELAHQWFGDLVTTPNWSHIWINEGWASFLPTFYERERNGQEAFDLSRHDTFQGGLGAHLGNPEKYMVWPKYNVPMDMFDGFAYSGGASRMFMLMHQLGEEKFWKAIKEYLEQYKFKNVDTEQFFNAITKSTNVDLNLFRKQWFYTPAAPSLTVKRGPNGYVIEQGSTPFNLDLELMFIDANGKVERSTINTKGGTTVAINGHSDQLLVVDPEVWLMGEIKYEAQYQAKDWLQIYRLSPNAAGKLRAIEAGWGTLNKEQRIQLFRTEKSEPMRERLISMIQDTDFLLEQTHNPDARIIQSALSNLAYQLKNEKVSARAKELAQNSKNDLVRQAAYQAWINHAGDDALATKFYATDSYNERIREMALEWWVSHDQDKAREICLAALANPISEPVRLTAIRALGRLKDKPGERKVFNALAAIMDDRSNSPLRAAISALAEYGDKAAIPLLQKRANHGLHFVRGDVQNALSRLGAN